MARRRFLVALVPPPRLLHQLRGLRAALGGPAVERIVPHVTLVPPFNVPDGGDSQVRRDLRAAVTDAAPIEVVLGPAASFAPANPTLHLAVGGDLAGLGRLRERVRAVAPGRRDRHPFVPHLTLLRDASAAVTDAAGCCASWRIRRRSSSVREMPIRAARASRRARTSAGTSRISTLTGWSLLSIVMLIRLEPARLIRRANGAVAIWMLSGALSRPYMTQGV